MKKLFLISLAAAGMLATSCQDYDPWDGDVAKYEFRKDFKAHFGNIDFSNTWNFAEQQSVFVSPGTSQDVKIYAKTDGVYTLAGSFTGIDHAQWLYVDVVAGTSELIVSNGNRSIETFVGGEANFSGTRAANDDGVEITHNDGSDLVNYPYRIIDLAKATEFERLLPSGKNNRGRLTEDFLYVSRGPFMLYPQSWGAWANDKVGIYYYDANGNRQDVEIFSVRGGATVLEYQTLNAGGTLEYQPLVNDANVSYNKFKGSTPVDGGGTPDPNCTYERSRGFLVNVPEGMMFGLYVENPNEQQKYYSEKQLNPTTQSHAVTFTMDGELYVAMEDDHSESDYDLNDIIVCFGPPVLPIIQDQDILKWVLCFEDLGNSFDIDYNDVVIGVTNPVNNEVTVTPLAAGGTLASYVFYGENPVGSANTAADDGEIHGMFGFPKAVSGQYTPINVSSNKTTFDTGINRQVSVNAGYSLAPYAVGGTEATPGTSQNMGNFYVKVVPSGEEATVTNATVIGQKIAPSDLSNVESGATNYENVPYVFCVPHRWRDHESLPFTYFRWSKEMIPMTTSYADPGHSFANWVNNKEQAVDWYRHPNEATTLTDRENHSYTPGGDDNDQVNDRDHKTNYCPSFEYEKCLINRDEIITTSSSHESSSNVSAYELEIPKADLHIVHHNETGADGEIHSEVVHDLTTYSQLRMAFVATGLVSNKSLTVGLYKVKGSTETLVQNLTLDINSGAVLAIDGSSKNADYAPLTLNSSSMAWSNVDKLVVKVDAHDADVHLNSIWVALSENDIDMQDHSELANALTTDGASMSVIMANPSTTEPNFLGSGSLIRYSKTLAGMLFSAEAIATATSGNQTKAQLTITRVGTDGSGNPKVTIVSDGKYLRNYNNQVQWVSNYESGFCDFTIVPRNNNGSTSACIAGFENDKAFRIQANNNNYLNASGPKFAGGINEWSYWYILKNTAGQHGN